MWGISSTSSRPRELLEELGDREAVGRRVRHVVDLGVRGAVQGGGVGAEHDVAVAAARRHAGPLVADEDHAAPVGVEAVDLAAQPLPLLLGHLEVVGLVAHRIEQGDVAAEREVLLDRPGADGRPGLAVQVAPEGSRLPGGERVDQVRLGTQAGAAYADARLAAGQSQARQAGDGDLAAAPAHRGRQRVERAPITSSCSSPVKRSQGLPHRSSALTSASNGSPGPHRGRRHRHQPMRIASHHVELRRGLQHRVELGAERVDEDAPLAAALAEGLGAGALAAAAVSPMVMWMRSPG